MIKRGISGPCQSAVLVIALILGMTVQVQGQTHKGHNGKKTGSTTESKQEKSPGAFKADNEKSNGVKTVSLDDLLKDASEHNPAIMAAMEAAQASRQMILPSRTLPDPTVRFENMGELFPPKLMPGDPSSARTYGVEQEIPFPGKLKLRGQIATAEAEAQEINHELIMRQISSELKQAYYDLFLAHKSAEIVRRTKDLLQNFSEISESRYQVGQGIQQDVLKAQVEISKLIDRLVVIDRNRTVAEAQINRLLHRPIGTELGKPVEYPKSELTYSLDQLEELARKSSPELRAQEKEVERRGYSVNLAQREYYPDMAVGYTYFEREDQEDMHRLMVSVKVPLYFWRRQRPSLQAAQSNLTSARHMRDNTLTTIGFQLKDAHTRAQSSDELIRLYSKAILPQSKLAMESAVASYQVGRVDFLTVIDSLTSVLEYELKYYESLTEFHKALAQMEPIVGIDLTVVRGRK